MRAVVVAIFMFSSLLFAGDPFMNKEGAVGYIVVDQGGKTFRFIVVEDEQGRVKLIKTNYNPNEVLKQGGKKE